MSTALEAGRRGLLAVAFGPPTMAAARDGLRRIRATAECVELRLDLFEEAFDLRELLAARGSVPVVVTLRPPAQGGRSPLPPAERLEVLVRAAALGAEYVDLEYDVATPTALERVRAAGGRVIVSRHDFGAMPGDLASGWWPGLAKSGADVVKVVGTAQTVLDALEVFRVFARADRSTIAIAMGPGGLLTRVLALRAPTCFLTYAALESSTGTAPGQLTLDEMRSTYRVDRLGPTTRVYGLLGPRVEADRLAEYNAWFAADGLADVAVPLTLPATGEPSAATIVTAFRELPISGWHVHGVEQQRAVAGIVDGLAPRAAAQGRANAIVRGVDGALRGDWVESPSEQYALWRDAARGGRPTPPQPTSP